MTVTIAGDDCVDTVGRAVREMAAIVRDLDDEDANELLAQALDVISDSGDGTEAVLARFAQDVADSHYDGPALMHINSEVSRYLGRLEAVRDARRAGPPPFDPPVRWLREKRGVKWSRPGPDLIPAWVADMDYPVAPPIRAALTAMLDRGDLGYPDWSQNPLADVFADRMQRRFGWHPEPAHVRLLADLIQALQVFLDLTTEPGDGVVAHLPNYPPFPAAIATMRRRLVPVQLNPAGESWSWERADLEAAAAQARVLLLVNPQNPTGRAFTRTELLEVADVAETHDLLVICDEIHAEMVHAPHEHIPFASVSPQAAARTVTLTSATKAYNIAGVRTAVAHIGPQWVRDRWSAQPPELYGQPSTLGIEATTAAWCDSDVWLAQLCAYLRAQRDHLATRVAELPDDPAAFFRAKAGLELAPGPDYDPKATGWVRLNYATSRALLDEIVDRMAGALADRQ
jgi:bifunctional pyridoxal-dependent enzyme with beta-cystathionase and maltose regulon repressor activities